MLCKIKYIILLVSLPLILYCICLQFETNFIEFETIPESTSKPILKVKYLHQDANFTFEKFGMISEILMEKYNIVLTRTLHDMLYDGGFTKNSPLPSKYKINIFGKGYDLLLDGVFRRKPTNLDNRVVNIFYTGEPKPALLDGYDLSIGFDYIDSSNYMRIPLYYLYYGNKISTSYNRGVCNPSKPYFACFLVSSKGTSKKYNSDGCAARNIFFHRLSEYKKVVSGGKHLNNIGRVIPKEETMEFLSKCKFIIAYENMTYGGYISEKVFQAYYAGAVPLYYADPAVLNDINPKAVVFEKNYNSQEEMIEYIKKIDQDDKLYCDIWNEKIITNSARNYESVKAALKQKLELLLKEKRGL